MAKGSKACHTFGKNLWLHSASMPRYALVLEYDGTFFKGWQWQPNLVTVQGVLQDALFSLIQKRLTVFGAGRTDGGVHALAQVAHIQWVDSLSLDCLRRGLNFYLKSHGVRVLRAQEVPDTFHARFSAMAREYTYRIFSRPSDSPIWRRRAWWMPYALDIEAMMEGAKILVGTHDFSSFRCADCQALSPIKTLDHLFVERQGEHILVHAKARSFLHHQVRMMVGALVKIGRGHWIPQQLVHVLQAKKRGTGAPTAPSEGLYLTKIHYPPEAGFV